MIVTIAGSTFSFNPNDAELAAVNLEFAAFDGAIGSGQFPIPDPASAIDPVTGRQFKVVQDFALLTDGFMIDRDRQRGPFLVGTQREFAISVQDANALLDGFRILQSRPSETDYARVIAFAAAYGSTLGVAWDTTWVLNSSTATMPAKKYDDDGGFGTLIQDLVAYTGKTMFLHDKAGGGRCLHYHILTTGHTCGLSISDVVTAQNGVTVFAPISPDDQGTSIDLRNDILGRDQSGRTSSATDATSISAHDADGLLHQAIVDFETTSQSDLNVQTAAFLASNKDEYHTYTCTIGPLDGTALGNIRVGDIITVTSGAMGLTASPQRIAHMRLKVAGSIPAPGLWMAELELGAPVRRRRRLSNIPKVKAAAPPNPPVPVAPGTVLETVDFQSTANSWRITHMRGFFPSSPPDDSYTANAAGPFIPTKPWAFIDSYNNAGDSDYEQEARGYASCLSSYPAATHAHVTAILYGRTIATPPGYAIDLHYAVYEGTWGIATPSWGSVGSLLFAGTITLDEIASVSLDFTVPLVDGYGQFVIEFDEVLTTHVNADATAIHSADRYPGLLSSDGQVADEIRIHHPSYTVSDTSHLFQMEFISVATPLLGQDAKETLAGDGSTTAFTLTYAYSPNGLKHVTVDGVDLTGDVTETTPGSGVFTFATAPLLDAVIEVIYQRAL